MKRELALSVAAVLSMGTLAFATKTSRTELQNRNLRLLNSAQSPISIKNHRSIRLAMGRRRAADNTNVGTAPDSTTSSNYPSDSSNGVYTSPSASPSPIATPAGRTGTTDTDLNGTTGNPATLQPGSYGTGTTGPAGSGATGSYGTGTTGTGSGTGSAPGSTGAGTAQ